VIDDYDGSEEFDYDVLLETALDEELDDVPPDG
jgi:hypothetical protein